MIPASATPDVQDAFRRLEARLDKLLVGNQDMHQRRLVNCSPSIDAFDYVTQFELNELEKRVVALETKTSDLEARVTALEA